MKERSGCKDLLGTEMAWDVEFSGAKKVWLKGVHVKRGRDISRPFGMWQAERSAQLETQIWRMKVPGFVVVEGASPPTCRRTISRGLVGEGGERERIGVHQ